MQQFKYVQYTVQEREKLILSKRFFAFATNMFIIVFYGVGGQSCTLHTSVFPTRLFLLHFPCMTLTHVSEID